MKKPLRSWLVSFVLVMATPWAALGGEVAAASAPVSDTATAGVVRAELARSPDVADAIRLLEAWIESQMAYRGLPGLSLGIVYDQELVWARGFGFADLAKKTPATAQTLYRIASNSKLFTSVAILQLRDEGKLGLDDPVEKHLRWFALRGRSLGEEPVTVRNLLTHTGGLPREAPFTSWTENRFPTREQIEESVPAAVRVYPPYTKWKYSNLGLALAGEIVETVSGERYDAYVRRHILEPLGMTSSAAGVPEALRPRLAVGYGRRLPDGSRSVRPYSDLAGLDPAAGLTSSVEDLARFAALQFRDGPREGAQVLAGSSIREMHRVQWISPDWKRARGLGFALLRQDDRTLVGHGGTVPGYQTSFMTSPEEKIAVIALTNADDGQPGPGTPVSIVDRAFKWVAPALRKAASPPPIAPRPKPEWEAYLGTYRGAWADMVVTILKGRLALINPLDGDPGATKLTLVEIGPHTFRTESAAPFGQDGDTVVFEMDATGRARSLAFPAERLEHVSP